MGDRTGISWTDRTWNPVRGCSRVSEGCRHCYAETMAARIVNMSKGKPSAYDGLVKLTADGEPRWTGKVVLEPMVLAQPLSWRKSSRVFVNSMSDLFHESLTNEQIAAVFGVMAMCPQHTFQVLTKRAKRMREWFEWVQQVEEDPIATTGKEAIGWGDVGEAWPLPNVWIGVSVENQEAANERVPELLATPAAVRFLSCEPLLGPVDVQAAIDRMEWHTANGRIDWIIAGCESGAGARRCNVDWLRSLRDQCTVADVPFFLKQAVEDIGDADRVCGANDSNRPCRRRIRYFTYGPGSLSVSCGCTVEGAEDANGTLPIIVGDGSKRKPGGVIELPYLDGVQHAAMPEVPRG